MGIIGYQGFIYNDVRLNTNLMNMNSNVLSDRKKYRGREKSEERMM